VSIGSDPLLNPGECLFLHFRPERVRYVVHYSGIADVQYGDSGGALFIKNGSIWELAGVLYAIGPYPSQPDATALQGKVSQPIGNLTYSVDLSVYRDQIIALTRPECANEVDDDGDTLVDWPDDPDCASELGLTELPDQDDDGVADAQLRVPDRLPVRRGHSRDLLRAEGFLVELDRLRAVADGEVRRDGVHAVGDRLHGGHGGLLRRLRLRTHG
jgi:hypothetical protein